MLNFGYVIIGINRFFYNNGIVFMFIYLNLILFLEIVRF